MKPSICVKFIGIGNSGIGIISRLVLADKDIAALLTQADSLVVISNERLTYASRQ